MKILLHICIVLLSLKLSSQSEDRCPPNLQDGCECTHKKKGLLIECNNVEYVAFPNLSSNVSVDIDLSSNKLTFLNASVFPHPNKITKLILRNNDLKRIDKGTFEGFNALKELDLSFNYLVQIRSSTFRGLENSNVTKLNLKNNRILQISKTAFENLNIDYLDLSEQKSWNNKMADIISYSNFLSFSLIKKVDLSDNSLLCDCNMKWMWSSSGRVTDQSTCFYPIQLRGTKVNSLSTDWDCGMYYSQFSLPEFHLSPYKNQVVLENDHIEYYCYSTWMELSTIDWFMNGVRITDGDYFDITQSVNLTLGFFSSKLVINSLTNDFNGNITCRVDVSRSGIVSATRNLFIITKNLKKCQSNTTRTERGVIYWPTSLSGAVIQAQCPYGSINNEPAYRECTNGVWKSTEVNECLFQDPSTRKLQQYYLDTRTHSLRKIVSMARDFRKTFALNHHLIRSKYDLYFLYKMLHEIMTAYKGRDGRTYSAFFWNATGMIADNHQYAPSMKEIVYGHTSGWRFRKLLESFVSDQVELENYRLKFLLNTHHSMSAASYLFSTTTTGEVHCYVTLLKYFQVHCYSEPNKQANKVASIALFLNVGANVRQFRLTLMAFKTLTFFQSTKKDSLDETSTLSSIVGLKLRAKLNDGSDRVSIPALQLAYSKDAFKLENPRLVFWSSPDGEDMEAEWESPTSCFPSEQSTKATKIYRCRYFDTPNMTYIAVVTKKPVPVYLDANYLEPIIYIGAAFSSIFLIFTLLIYVYFCYVRRVLYNRTDSAALMNLCIVLLVAEVVFAVGIHRVDDPLLCTGVAFGLHYFILCAFVWLGCGAVALLRLVKKKDRADVSVYDPVMKYYLVGWGLPLIICSITVAYDYHNYGTDEYCWLSPKTSLGAFIGVGSVILLCDLIVFCFLHAAINRLFPEPIEGRPTDDSSCDEMEDLNCNRDECNAKQCRYKMQQKQYKKTGSKVLIPKRRELLHHLHAGLLILLLLCLTITFVLMIYGYKSSKSRYLYFFFTYGSAISNVMIGFIIFYFHCWRRRDLQKLIKQTTLCVRHSHQNPDTAEAIALVDDNDHNNQEITEPIPENGSLLVKDIVGSHHGGVYGLSDHVVSDGSQFISTSIAPEVVKLNEKPLESETEPQIDDPTSEKLAEEAPSEQDLPYRKAPMSQSELSEVECLSNTHNSIGECSLVSSSAHKKSPPKPIDIPQNLKNFVPENWRPARRRMNKGASYYPYYVSETTPISASLAYSSKSSSLASTTVSGVPLYKKNMLSPQHPNNALRHPKGMAAPMVHPQQHLQSRFPNVPIRFAPPPPSYQELPILQSNIPLPITKPHPQLSDIENSNRVVEDTVLEESEPSISEREGTPKMEENDEEDKAEEEEKVEEEHVREETEEEIEDDSPAFVVSPNLYIPMPHVSIKQFIFRSETSV